MMTITASQVATLRGKTDAPMMECKRALADALGDMDRAEEILRAKLGDRAVKAAGRVSAEGIVVSRVSGGVGVLAEINCETDFVAKNPDFLGFSNDVAGLIAEQNPADVQALMALSMGEGTVESTRAALVGKIGENVSVRRFVRHATSQKLAAYVHDASIGVIVEFSGEQGQVGADVAMHVAAMKPLAVSAAQIPAEWVAKERAVAELKAAQSGKPPAIAEKMIEGSVNKYLRSVSLLSQNFVKNDKQTVEQMLKAQGATVSAFTLFVVGDGIQKAAGNFAAEVAAQVAAAQKV